MALITLHMDESWHSGKRYFMNITVYMKKTLRPIEQTFIYWLFYVYRAPKILAYDKPYNNWVIFHPIYTANDFRGPEMVTAKKMVEKYLPRSWTVGQEGQGMMMTSWWLNQPI